MTRERPVKLGYIEFRAPAADASESPTIRRSLQRYGITDNGITQLLVGQPVSNASDRRRLAEIVAAATGSAGRP